MKITKILAGSILIFCVIIAVASAGCTGNPTQNIVGDVKVIADSKLTTPMDDIIKAFDKKYPKVNISITYGDSADIASQIISGTVTPNNFVSMDTESIDKVVKANLTAGYFSTTMTYKVMVDTATNDMGVLFLAFMNSADAKAIFKSHGYIPSNTQ